VFYGWPPLHGKNKGVFMTKYEVKEGNEESDPGDDVDPLAMPPRDPIEPDPMNPVQSPPTNTDPKPAERPDLDWSGHED
jgi:hypothetical protein